MGQFLQGFEMEVWNEEFKCSEGDFLLVWRGILMEICKKTSVRAFKERKWKVQGIVLEKV
jgi:hypothetical protein